MTRPTPDAAGGQLPVPVPRRELETFAESAGSLGVAVRLVTSGTSSVAAGATADIQDQAWYHLQRIQPLLLPAREDDMLAWLGRLAPMVSDAPLSIREIRARAIDIWEVCSPLPRGVWCDASRVGWCRRQPSGRFWPTPGQLYGHLLEFARVLWRDRGGCERILAEAARPEVSWPAPSDAERAAVRETLQGFRAVRFAEREAEAAREQPDRPPTPWATLSPDQLAETYEQGAARGCELARLRLEGLVKAGASTPHLRALKRAKDGPSEPPDGPEPAGGPPAP